MSNALEVKALLIEISILPIQAPSMRTWEIKFPPASTTAIFMGWPISSALRSAASINDLACANVISIFIKFCREQLLLKFKLKRKHYSDFIIFHLSAIIASIRYFINQPFSLCFIISDKRPGISNLLLYHFRIIRTRDQYSNGKGPAKVYGLLDTQAVGDDFGIVPMVKMGCSSKKPAVCQCLHGQRRHFFIHQFGQYIVDKTFVTGIK